MRPRSWLGVVVTLGLIVSLALSGTAKLRDKSLAQTAAFPIGVACDPTLIQDRSGYRRVVTNEFNSITAETVHKWAALRPAPGKYDFTKADELVSFARKQGKRIHGHTLLWHSPDGNPQWLREFKGDKSAWKKLLKDHIYTVVNRYRGQVKSWDVVNEAFTETGELRMANPNPEPGKDDGSIWARNLGPDYIALAFRYAHEADPKALLFYNDFNQNLSPRKMAAIEGLVKDLRRRRIPIHGLGLQFHLDISNSNEGISRALRASAATGLLVHISELDILTSNWKQISGHSYTPELQRRHGEKYRFIAQEYQRQVPPRQRYGITHWNVGDSDSWITQWLKLTDWPLLFDENYQRKQVYYDYRRGLQRLRHRH
jgi:endo-1,4-beta-xylanase